MKSRTRRTRKDGGLRYISVNPGSCFQGPNTIGGFPSSEIAELSPRAVKCFGTARGRRKAGGEQGVQLGRGLRLQALQGVHLRQEPVLRGNVHVTPRIHPSTLAIFTEAFLKAFQRSIEELYIVVSLVADGVLPAGQFALRIGERARSVKPLQPLLERAAVQVQADRALVWP